MTEDRELLEDTDAYRNFVRHLAPILTKGATKEILIIRGHLLAEELLRQILKEQANFPAALQDARLSFIQVLKVASAFTILSSYKDLQAKLQLLNRLRNTLAHEMDGDIDKHIAKFITLSIDQIRTIAGWRRYGALRQLAFAMASVCGEMAALCQVFEYVRKHKHDDAISSD